MPVVLPSPFLEEAVAGFQAKVQEYRTCLSELEQVKDMPCALNWCLLGLDLGLWTTCNYWDICCFDVLGL